MKKYNIEITKEEIHDLYDMLYMMDTGILKINGCLKSWESLFEKIEPIVVPELHEKDKNRLRGKNKLSELEGIGNAI